MLTVLEILKKTTGFFEKCGVESPRLNAELLVGHALGLKRMQLYLQFERLLTEPELEKIRPLVKRRGSREPLQYILGSTEFASLTLKVDRRALIPRPETEFLIELIGEKLGEAPKRILNLGVGSGAIALALAKKYPEARVLGVDRSREALTLAQENAVGLDLANRIVFKESDWFASLAPEDGHFELIVSNPPYLSNEEVNETQPEVRNFEPRMALCAGDSGLADLAKIIQQAPIWLAPSGQLVLETGIAQHSRLAGLAQGAGFQHVQSLRDLTGRDRFYLAAF